MTPITIILSAIIIALLVLLIKSSQKLKKYNYKYKDIIDVDATLSDRKKDFDNWAQKIENQRIQFNNDNKELNQDYLVKKGIYESLLKETSLLEENLEDISYGLYKPHYNWSLTS